MADIGDLFGKASIDTDHSVATTVSAERTAGVTVLSGFDLSTFTEDTPVFFVTYTKTVDPLTSAVTITDLVSWKGLVNAGANTITNLTAAPGYVDAGNTTGQFIECIPTSYWVNSMMNGILSVINPDGTLKVIANNPGWTEGGSIPTTVVYNGNGSYTLTHPSSIAATSSVGYKNKYTRTVTASDQCADLEASSSQYADKTSPTGITFTDNFTCEAWIKLESYGGGLYSVITRTSAGDGWAFDVLTTGEVRLVGDNAGADYVQSYQSIPINRWVHIAASINISVGTGAVYIDGISVPTDYTDGTATGTANTGPLWLGAREGSSLFDGKISDVRIWSVVRTATEIRANKNQALVGTEANLVAYYKLDGDFTDSTANNNDLTASGGALATDDDTPFTQSVVGTSLTAGTTNYSVTTSISADGLTETVQTAEGDTIPTSGGISAVSYSTQGTPYAFPKDEGKWDLVTIGKTEASTTSTSYTTTNFKLTTPIGPWRIEMDLFGRILTTAANITRYGLYGLSSDGSTVIANSVGAVVNRENGTSSSGGGSVSTSFPVSLSATTYYELLMNAFGSSNEVFVGDVNVPQPTTIKAKFNLL